MRTLNRCISTAAGLAASAAILAGLPAMRTAFAASSSGTRCTSQQGINACYVCKNCVRTPGDNEFHCSGNDADVQAFNQCPPGYTAICELRPMDDYSTRCDQIPVTPGGPRVD